MVNLYNTTMMNTLYTTFTIRIGSLFRTQWMGNSIILFFLLNAVSCTTSRTLISNKCEHIPRDPQLVQRAGDGEFEIQIFLLPPGQQRLRGSGNQGMFWPISFNKQSTNVSVSGRRYKPLREYIPGRDYQIILKPKTDPIVANAFQLEAVYLTAVPVGTPQNQEIHHSKGTFSPTICASPNIGAIEIKYNFPRQINFVWTAPKVTAPTQTDVYQPLTWESEPCLEIRATVVPWHWHRMYFRNTGNLKHVLCPAKDLRQIDHWPNYVEAFDHSSRPERKPDGVRVRSIQSDGRVDGPEARDRYSDSGFYGTDESGSCSVQELPKPVRRCCACNTAVYRLVIQSDWQQQQHWRDWPTVEVTPDGKTLSPHWSEILGASHSPLYDVFHAGGFASPAVDALCTTSDVSKLESEFRNQAGENIFTVIRTRGIDSAAPPKQRIRSALFAVNSTHHLISFLTRLVPSTDWCTGLSRVDVCLPNCSWPLRMQFRLEPWDAGVMSGNTYVPVEPSERLREPKPMCPITPDLRPNTPFTVQTDYIPLPSVTGSDTSSSEFVDLNMDDPNSMGTGKNPFHIPGRGSSYSKPRRLLHSPTTTRLRRTFARLGTVELELLRINEHETCTPEPAQEDQAFGQTRSDASAPPTRCQLGSWSQWGPCTMVDPNTCQTAQAKSYWSSKAPETQRTRVLLPPSTLEDCAGMPLKEEKTCDPVTVKERCPTGAHSVSISSPQMLTAEVCQSLPWGHWSQCLNATCSRPGMIYRWRRFPNQQSRQACENYPDVSQVDTCWPPPNIPCSVDELKKACSEEPPSTTRLCVTPQNGTIRYFFNPQEKRCQQFEYVPACHLRALMQQHTIGQTRNVFYDRSGCEKLCLFNADGAKMKRRYLIKRDLSRSGKCSVALDVGSSCMSNGESLKWYFDREKEQCIEFLYLGCGGNENRFDNRDECETQCKANYELSFHRYGQRRQPSSYNSPACQYSEWSAWSSCDRTCGLGTRRRLRTPLQPRSILCHSSNAATVQEEPCQLPTCPIS